MAGSVPRREEIVHLRGPKRLEKHIVSTDGLGNTSPSRNEAIGQETEQGGPFPQLANEIRAVQAWQASVDQRDTDRMLFKRLRRFVAVARLDDRDGRIGASYVLGDRRLRPEVPIDEENVARRRRSRGFRLGGSRAIAGGGKRGCRGGAEGTHITRLQACSGRIMRTSLTFP